MGDFNLLPKEAFESIASVSNNLIEKISLATGYIVTPKGKKKDMEEAVSFFIDKIKSDDSMPDLMKAACISNARKMIRGYSNQHDILGIAMDNLKETAGPDLLNDDWLIDFWEKAGCVNDNDIKLIFGKILADACNNRDVKASKTLIHKLYLMDGKNAKALQKLRKYAVQMETIDVYGDIVDEEFNILYFNNYFGWEEKYSRAQLELMELEVLGIITNGPYTIRFENESNNAESKTIKEIRIHYNDSFISITGDGKGNFEELNSSVVKMPAGTICLARDGQFLMRSVECSEYLKEYLDDVKNLLKKVGYRVQ